MKLHQFVKRNIAPDNSSKITVIRVICKPNQQKRIDTGEKLQYTTTILPGFLIPHSRIPLPDLYAAFDRYLCNEQSTQQEVALLMNCQSRHSFRLYFQRLCENIDKWLIFLSDLVCLNSRKEKWNRLKKAIKSLSRESSKPLFPRTAVFHFEYAMSFFLSSRMGLGP